MKNGSCSVVRNIDTKNYYTIKPKKYYAIRLSLFRMEIPFSVGEFEESQLNQHEHDYLATILILTMLNLRVGFYRVS